MKKAQKQPEARGVCASENELIHAPEENFEWIKDETARLLLRCTNTRQFCIEHDLENIRHALKTLSSEIRMISRHLDFY